MKNVFLYILVPLQLLSLTITAQPNCHIEHYGLTDGLPQRTVMSILQDQKGFMWFSTWDGICRFDGENFTTYKSSEEDLVWMRSNRSDKIRVDEHGDIWVHSYNREVFRFNPRTETFTATFFADSIPFLSTDILPMSSGKVWLTSNNQGVICVLDTTNTYLEFNIKNGTLKGDSIYTVFEDSNLDSWILTNNGVTKVSYSGNEVTTFLFGNSIEKNTSFFSAFELNDEIWFGSNGRIWCFQKREEKFKEFKLPIKSNVVDIDKIFDDLFVICTSNDGFIICDKEKNNLKVYNRQNQKVLPTNELISCYVDRSKNVWLELNCFGIARFDFLQNKLNFYTPSNITQPDMPYPPRFRILEDHAGRIWVHPKGGGFSYYDKISDKLLPFFNDSKLPNWKFSNLLHDAFIDKQGNLWISTRSDGLEKVVFDNDFFIQNLSFSPPFSEQEVRAIFEDSNYNLWIGAKDGRIYVYDSDKNFKGVLCDNGEIKPNGTPIKGMAYTIVKDRKNNIWIGTKGEGLYLLEPHGTRTDLKYNITNFRYDKKNTYSLSSNNIYSVYEDNNGRIWVGAYGGGLNLFDSGKFINYRNELKNYPHNGYQVRSINSDKNGCILVGTTLGLIAFYPDYNNPNSVNYKILINNPQEKNSISANDIFSIYKASDGDTYLATYGGGLCKIIEKDKNGYPSKFKSYKSAEGLPSDVILSITEDNEGKLWISSEGNLSEFDSYEETFKTFNDVSRIMEKNFFSEAQAIKTHSGEIIFGRRKGTLSFFPENIFIDDFKPYLALTRFRISNKNFPLTGNIDNISEINLAHNENSFSMEYIALDYSNPQNIIYSYRLDGFDNDWIPNQKQQIASYTNIAPGNYVFRVRSTNSNGNWVNNEHSIRINISPVFWQTGWAYAIYTIVFLLILFIVFRVIFAFYRMRDRIRIEREQTEMKTRFFTDISHEIRTPLTMIVSPVENILESEDTPEEVRSQLNLVLKNSSKMLTMVNQILDFRKIQKKEFSIEEVAIGEYISEICNNYFIAAKKQNIKFTVNNEVGYDKIWIDKEAVEKLIFNLISNAIKNTNSGNTIEVNILRRDKTIALQVKDDGNGMSKETLAKLFTRFASFNLDKSKPSTGIGLSIVKEVVDKHHAKILVKSEVGRGSNFIVLFHKGIEHFSKDPNVIVTRPNFDEASEESSTIVLDSENNQSEIDEVPSILVVEDDTDLRSFIKSVLSDQYQVYEADNGKNGYELTIQNIPDFIISDIMMPDMDGIEFLQKIKNNSTTSHIPFILLTAKSSINDEIEGIEYGADDYIKKPFNVKLLRAKIKNIFEQRKRIFSHDFGNKVTAQKNIVSKEKGVQITPQDEAFIKRITEEIEKNIDNSEFFVDDLVAATNFSRKVFFKKLKSLTGIAPVEFIREVRIKYAANLLATENYSVKEISYMVGFSDIKYFTKCFKKTYNMTPTQYRSEAKH